MSLASSRLGSPAHEQAESTSLHTAADVGDLAAIFHPNVNVAVHPRTLSDAVLRDACRAMTRSRLMLAVPPTFAGKEALTEEMPDAQALALDVFFLVELLADLTGAAVVGVRLACVEAAMCARLHVDRVTLRMVTTYLGPGTEYVAHEGVDRRYLGHAAIQASEARRALLRPGARVVQASAGAIVLLKGERWPDNEGRGAVHRSPLASRDAPRLVLTLDAL